MTWVQPRIISTHPTMLINNGPLTGHRPPQVRRNESANASFSQAARKNGAQTIKADAKQAKGGRKGGCTLGGVVNQSPYISKRGVLAEESPLHYHLSTALRAPFEIRGLYTQPQAP